MRDTKPMDDLGWLKQQKACHTDIKIPPHIAVIMDGNSRWAERFHHSRTWGHHQGAQALKRTVRACYLLKIPYLTLYAFSMENWQRPKEEVDDLMELLVMYLRSERSELKEHGIRLHVIGNLDLLPLEVQQEVMITQEFLNNSQGMTLTLAISYSAREEITRAVQTIAKQVSIGHLEPEDITAEVIGNSLSTAGIPDPDLLIRTSGEMRLSNFLLWQMAYTEFYFSDSHWPEFNAKLLWQAITDFHNRKRRFGQRVDHQPNKGHIVTQLLQKPLVTNQEKSFLRA
ncbi:MAG: isoprenyl transferase [Proteobacteria bacterium]|nr:isoprenyl transferase [Pseudomonadota bacterium]